MPIAIDLEWSSETPQGTIPHLVSVAWASDEGAGVLAGSHDRKQIVDTARASFRDGFVGHNCPGDIAALLLFEPSLMPDVMHAYIEGRIYDTMTREKRINIALGEHVPGVRYDLGSVAKRRANVAVDKNDPWRMRYGELAGVPISEWPQAAYQYALDDATATWAVYREQEQHADLLIGNDIHARSHWVTYLVGLRGVDVDREWVRALSRDVGTEVERLRGVLCGSGLARVGGSKKAPKIVRATKVARDLASQLGAADTTAKGLVSLSQKALAGLHLPTDHPLCAYQELATLTGTASKNLPCLQYPTITTQYDECISTGRMASRGGREANATNLQNLPKPVKDPSTVTQALFNRFRGCLVPPPGYVFGVVDYASAELVTFADVEMAWFGDSKMGDAIRAGRNLHTDFAEVLIGGPYDASNPEHKTARAIAKVFNFGKLGGMGDEKFRAHIHTETGIGLPIDRVRTMTRAWKSTWGTERYFRHIDRHKSLGKFRIAAPRTGFIRGGMTYTEACNFPFQSTAAVGMKVAVWDLFSATHSMGPLRGAWISLIVHDEVVMCLPEVRAKEALVEQERIMIESFGRVCTGVPVGVEGSLQARYGS